MTHFCTWRSTREKVGGHKWCNVRVSLTSPLSFIILEGLPQPFVVTESEPSHEFWPHHQVVGSSLHNATGVTGSKAPFFLFSLCFTLFFLFFPHFSCFFFCFCFLFFSVFFCCFPGDPGDPLGSHTGKGGRRGAILKVKTEGACSRMSGSPHVEFWLLGPLSPLTFHNVKNQGGGRRRMATGNCRGAEQVRLVNRCQSQTCCVVLC